MIGAVINNAFMQNALITAVLASVICAVVGTFIVEKRLVSMSGGIAHASFGGIGLSYFIGIEPIVGGVLVAVSASFAVLGLQRKNPVKADTLVGIFWSVGMALGILFIAITPGYAPDMTSYLFGDILTVSTGYVIVMAALATVVVLIVVAYFNYWKVYLFDEAYARVLKVNTTLLGLLLYLLVPIAIIMLVKVVGIILAIALLSIPASTAKLLCTRLKSVMLVSGVLGLCFCVLGLALSYVLDIPSGACIILLSALVYFLVFAIKRIRFRARHSHRGLVGNV